jgi:Protein of unknown function (DUF2934)
MKSRHVFTNTESMPKLVSQSDIAEEEKNSGPSPAEIRQRAFEIHIERGGIHGCDLDDWLQAERELRERYKNTEREPKGTEMRHEDDFAEISEKESNLEDTLDSRLVSHPKSALSLDRIPGGSLRIVAWSLDSVVPDNAVTLPATEEPRTDRGDSKEINIHPCG